MRIKENYKKEKNHRWIKKTSGNQQNPCPETTQLKKNIQQHGLEQSTHHKDNGNNTTYNMEKEKVAALIKRCHLQDSRGQLHKLLSIPPYHLVKQITENFKPKTDRKKSIDASFNGFAQPKIRAWLNKVRKLEPHIATFARLWGLNENNYRQLLAAPRNVAKNLIIRFSPEKSQDTNTAFEHDLIKYTHQAPNKPSTKETTKETTTGKALTEETPTTTTTEKVRSNTRKMPPNKTALLQNNQQSCFANASIQFMEIFESDLQLPPTKEIPQRTSLVLNIINNLRANPNKNQTLEPILQKHWKDFPLPTRNNKMHQNSCKNYLMTSVTKEHGLTKNIYVWNVEATNPPRKFPFPKYSPT